MIKIKGTLCFAVYHYRPFTTRNASITPEVRTCSIRADLGIPPVRRKSAVNSRQVMPDLAIRRGILDLVNVGHVGVIFNFNGKAATVVLSIVWGVVLVALIQLNWIAAIDAATHGALGLY